MTPGFAVPLQVFAEVCPMLGIDNMKKLETRLQCRRKPTAESQQLLVVSVRGRHANKTFYLWGILGVMKRVSSIVSTGQNVVDGTVATLIGHLLQ